MPLRVNTTEAAAQQKETAVSTGSMPDGVVFLKPDPIIFQLVLMPDQNKETNAAPMGSTTLDYYKNSKFGDKPHDKKLTQMMMINAIGMPATLPSDPAARQALIDRWDTGLQVVALKMTTPTYNTLMDLLVLSYLPAAVEANGSIEYGTWFRTGYVAESKTYTITPMPPTWKPESANIVISQTVKTLKQPLSDIAAAYAAMKRAQWEADKPPTASANF